MCTHTADNIGTEHQLQNNIMYMTLYEVTQAKFRASLEPRL